MPYRRRVSPSNLTDLGGGGGIESDKIDFRLQITTVISLYPVMLPARQASIPDLLVGPPPLFCLPLCLSLYLYLTLSLYLALPASISLFLSHIVWLPLSPSLVFYLYLCLALCLSVSLSNSHSFSFSFFLLP